MLHPVFVGSALVGALVVLLQPQATPDPVALPGSPVVTDDRQVTQQQLQCVRDSFATYFHGGSSTTSHSTIGPAQVDVGWTSLRTVMDSLQTGGDTIRAVRLHYGLATSTAPHAYRFTMGVEVLRLVPQGNDHWKIIEQADGFYTVSGTGQLQKTVLSSWGDDEVYFDHAFVRRASNTTTFEAVDRAVDTREFILPWETELLALHDDNPSCDSIRFVCIAEPGHRTGAVDEDMRHHLCGVALAGGTEKVNNSAVVPARPFQMKGADVGSPCPSICGEAYLPAAGMKLKNCP